MTWHSHLGPEMAFSYLSPNHLMSSLFDSAIGKHPILRIQHVMLNKVRLMMMERWSSCQRLGGPLWVGWGAPVPTMQQAASRTHARTHSRTHSRTHARIAVTRSQSRRVAGYVDDQYHVTQVLLLLKTASLITRLFSEMSIFSVLQTRNSVNRDFGLCSQYRRLLLTIKAFWQTLRWCNDSWHFMNTIVTPNFGPCNTPFSRLC